MTTLLQKAKATRTSINEFSPEIIEVFVAFLNNDITPKQAYEALKDEIELSTSSAVFNKATTVIRRAIEAGIVTVSFNNPKNEK